MPSTKPQREPRPALAVAAPDPVRDGFREALLGVMERKTHWAWPHFNAGEVARERLHVHFEQEWETYVRDFPIFLGRAYTQCPHATVRAELAENLYEEETGRLTLGKPHAQLFLLYPGGLGIDLARFERVELAPAAAAYRAFLDEATTASGWEVAVAIATIFVEGTSYERGELDPKARARPQPPPWDHPLVRHYGLPVDCLALTRAHRMVEGAHRAAAWRMVLDHVAPAHHARVVAALETALNLWLAYRDEVAAACGLERAASPAP